MHLLLQGLLDAIRSENIHFESKQIQTMLEQRVLHIIENLSNQDSLKSIAELENAAITLLGEKRAYRLLGSILHEYGSELTDDEAQALNKNVKMNDDDLRKRLVVEAPKEYKNKVKYKKEKVVLQSEQSRRLFDEVNPNTSYSGSDMVASITIPGKGPIVFGELSNVSYSVMREKVPVRSLGRVSMKGYTRGMRTITGILSFTVFNESIVYRIMDELKSVGYRMLMDEMPLFDITITMANEFGSSSSLTIYGVSTYTEGMVMSINDMLTQNVYEFYALDIDPIAKTALY